MIGGRWMVIALTVVLVACSSATRADLRDHHEVVLADGALDPNRIDLSGTPGETPAQQARAERFVRETILATRKWTNIQAAVAAGFVPLVRNLRKTNHLIHWDWINDNDYYDPERPESLVYDDGKLTAAMYVRPDRYKLDNAPNPFGPLAQLHSHANLCFSNTATPTFVRFTFDGHCRPPLVMKLTEA